MVRSLRTVAAGILALVIAALPVVLDRCAESCDAHRTIAMAPACHHTASAGSHVSSSPAPCGHDHHEAAVTAAKNPAPTERAFDSLGAVDRHVTGAPFAAADFSARPTSPPGSFSTLHRSLPLRV